MEILVLDPAQVVLDRANNDQNQKTAKCDLVEIDKARLFLVVELKILAQLNLVDLIAPHVILRQDQQHHQRHVNVI